MMDIVAPAPGDSSGTRSRLVGDSGSACWLTVVPVLRGSALGWLPPASMWSFTST